MTKQSGHIFGFSSFKMESMFIPEGGKRGHGLLVYTETHYKICEQSLLGVLL